MPDFVPPAGATPIDRDKLLTIGFMRGGRIRPRVREGRSHPETGLPWKATTDELGNTQTEHGDRLDARVRPKAVGIRLGAHAGNGA